MGTHRCATMVGNVVTLDTVSIVPKITRNVNKREPLKNKFSQSCEKFLPNNASEKLLCVWGEKY